MCKTTSGWIGTKPEWECRAGVGPGRCWRRRRRRDVRGHVARLEVERVPVRYFPTAAPGLHDSVRVVETDTCRPMSSNEHASRQETMSHPLQFDGADILNWRCKVSPSAQRSFRCADHQVDPGSCSQTRRLLGMYFWHGNDRNRFSPPALVRNKVALYDKRRRHNFVSRAACDIRASVGSCDASAAVFYFSQCHLMQRVVQPNLRATAVVIGYHP